MPGREIIDAGLVVVGGGGAGLAAALTAAERGARGVVVLEKRKLTGGNTALATGLFACESPVQERNGFLPIKNHSDRDAFFRRAMTWAHWSMVNPALVRAFISSSGDTIGWLEEKGVVFDLLPFYPDQDPPLFHCPKGRGAQLTRVLAAACRDLGVRTLVEASTTKILLSPEGRITGAVADTPAGEIEIRTGSVIVATGGFGGDQEKLKRLCPSYRESMGPRGLPLAGDGLRLASEAGAAIGSSVTLLKEGPRVDLHGWPLMGIEREPSTMWVNSSGRRFADEAIGDYPFESVNALLQQPGAVCYTLLDDRARQNLEEKLTHAKWIAGKGPGEGEAPDLAKRFQTEVQKGRAQVCDSLEEIALWIGCRPEVLKATVDEYNASCVEGYDKAFGKDPRHLTPLTDPPYFAIRGIPAYLDTLGGIRCDEHMQVLDGNNNPIPGLYAAGSTVAGWQPENYCGDLSGSAFAFAITSGRMAGENAAGTYNAPCGHQPEDTGGLTD